MPKYCISHNKVWNWSICIACFCSRSTWRVFERCLQTEGERWPLNWVFHILRRQGDLLQISYPHSVLVLVWNMFENNPFVQVLKMLWKHCWTLSWQESRGVLPISGFDKSNYKTKSLRANWEECQTYFQAKGQFQMKITLNKISEKSKPRAAVHQPKPGRGPFGSPTQGKW